MKKTVAKVICILLLIPILGFGLSFGSAYVYGKIRYAEKRSTVISILDVHENELLEIIKGNKTGSEETLLLEHLGFGETMQADNNFFFRLPYAGKLGSWVPCGLLYSNDLSTIERWQKTSPIREDWYFYWEP